VRGNNEIRPTSHSPPRQGGSVFSGAVQARRRGKRGARHFRGSGAHGQLRRRQPLLTVLDGQTLAAFGATSVDDSAATTGFHADAKAVRALAAGD